MTVPAGDKLVVYTPESSIASPIKMLRAMFGDLWAGRELAWRLAVRDISAQYRRSFLGILWALILPLANTLVWLFLNGSGIVQLQETPIPYPVYVFSGTMLWAIFMASITAPMQENAANSGMLVKLNFPKEALVLAGIYKNLFDSLIKVALMLCILPVFHVRPGWGLALFPLGVASLILAGTAIGLALTPVGMLYADIGKALPLVLQFFMYVAPVVFAIPESGKLAKLFLVNPVTPLILNARDWLTGQPPEMLGYFAAVNAGGLALLLVAWMAYRLCMPILVERLSA